MKFYVNSVGGPVIEGGKVVGVAHVSLRPVGFDLKTMEAMGPHPDGMITLARIDRPELAAGDCFEVALTKCEMPAAAEEKS